MNSTQWLFMLKRKKRFIRRSLQGCDMNKESLDVAAEDIVTEYKEEGTTKVLD